MARPKVIAEVRTDELGEYMVYTNRACTEPRCGVVLTSRNQHRSTLMCREHGPQREKPRIEIQKLLTAWLKRPITGPHREALMQAMNNYELKARLQRSMPM